MLPILDLTPTERRMYEVLSDGSLHSSHELHGCLLDDMGPVSNVKPHLTHLRKKLREHGLNITCVNGSGLPPHYYLSRPISHRE